jgi:hypothetical protein
VDVTGEVLDRRLAVPAAEEAISQRRAITGQPGPGD